MATEKDTAGHSESGRLVDTVRRLKIDSADRSDVVVDMKEADRARLELLAEALQPSFDEVPLDDDRFDFALSSGLQPRLWIDATAHVMMGRDRRVYRFVRDTRLGRIVLAESADMKVVETAVIDYIAERILERERIFAGETIGLRFRAKAPASDRASAAGNEAPMGLTKPEPGRLPVYTEPARSGNTGSAEMTEAEALNLAEPTDAQAFATMSWIALGLLAGGGLLLWFISQVG